MNAIPKKKIIFIIGGLAIIAALALFWGGQSLSLKSPSVAGAVQDVLVACESEEYRPSCYDERIPRLLGTFSVSEVFDIVRAVQDADESYGYCHVLGHKLGEIEVAKDPSQWMNVVAKSPTDGICANGFFHGALIERFASGDQWALSDKQIDIAVPELSIACEPREDFNPSLSDKAICYHGIGHMAMYITGADIPHALDVCDRVTSGGNRSGFRSVCYEGTFMQLFQPLEPEDEDLIADIDVSKENYKSFCSSFSTKQRNVACYVEAWPVVREYVHTPDGIVDFCSNISDRSREDHCFSMIYHTFAQGNNFDSKEIIRFCSALPLPRQGDCYAEGAFAMLTADPRFITRAVELCGALENERARCFSGLAGYAKYRFVAGSAEFDRLCSLIPERWRSQCSTG